MQEMEAPGAWASASFSSSGAWSMMVRARSTWRGLMPSISAVLRLERTGAAAGSKLAPSGVCFLSDRPPTAPASALVLRLSSVSMHRRMSGSINAPSGVLISVLREERTGGTSCFAPSGVKQPFASPPILATSALVCRLSSVSMHRRMSGGVKGAPSGVGFTLPLPPSAPASDAVLREERTGAVGSGLTPSGVSPSCLSRPCFPASENVCRLSSVSMHRRMSASVRLRLRA